MKAEVEFQKKFCQEVETVEQKTPGQDIVSGTSGLPVERPGPGGERAGSGLKKGDFKKKTKNGLTYQIWFDRSRYNYIDYEIGHGKCGGGLQLYYKAGR